MAASAIILYNKNKKILLQHRDGNAPTSPGKWGFFGGSLEKDETPLECVIRECFEELGYQLESPKLIEEKEINSMYVFIEKYNSSKKLILNEGDYLGWFSFNETDDLDMAIDCKKKLNNLKKEINNQS